MKVSARVNGHDVSKLLINIFQDFFKSTFVAGLIKA